MQKDTQSVYVTTTLPYVNAEPHVGFAMEIIRADVIARFYGKDKKVFFNTGTDEHGQKLFESAEEKHMPVREYVDMYAEKFRGLKDLLGIQEDVHFIRTTDSHHEKAAQEFWKRVYDRGYIYKKQYKAKYCVGCEEEKTESQLVDGKCPVHPNRELEIREEENYFFKLSEFGEKILDLFEKGECRVIPASRENEMKEFVKRGLEDFSISRLSSKMSWGIPVPNDPEHVMYVWFDALVNYISTLGWPHDTETFNAFWRDGYTIQYCGKDNTRFQSVMWQAMLLAADLPPTNVIVVNGFITGAGGVKMSKSIGNVVNPYDVVGEYGTDALRYFLLREISSFEDSPFTMDRFKESYNSGLANGIGNLVSRVMKMAETHLENPVEHVGTSSLPYKEYEQAIMSFDITKATEVIWKDISALDLLIQTEMPFKLVKTDPEKGKRIITDLVVSLHGISKMLEPIIPQTAQKIQELIARNVSPEVPLFARKD